MMQLLELDYKTEIRQRGTVIARGQLLPNTILGAPGIWSVFVHEDHRRQGHAREIVRRLLKVAAARGYTEVFLDVQSTNTPAIRLYKSFGFVVYEGFGWGTCLRMRLELA